MFGEKFILRQSQLFWHLSYMKIEPFQNSEQVQNFKTPEKSEYDQKIL